MKILFKISAAVYVTIAAGCTVVEELSPAATEDFNVEINANLTHDTRTLIGDLTDGIYPFTWENTDELAILENVNGTKSQVVKATVKDLSDDAKSASFSTRLGSKSGSTFDYYAYYPYSAYLNGELTLSSSQTARTSSVDPASALMYASSTGFAQQNDNLEFMFEHISAYARMTVTGLSSKDSSIEEVRFTVNGKSTAGTFTYSDSGYSIKNGTSTIAVDVSSLNYSDENDFEVWFSTIPVDEIAEFTVEVATSSYVCSKTFKSGRHFGLEQGVVSSFTVNMSNAESNNGLIYVEKKGSLEDFINEKGINAKTLEELRIAGHLNIFDYEYIKNMPNLKLLDLTEIEDEELPTGCLEASKIPTVLLPKTLKKINNRAFYGAAITSISIPETVEYIGDYAFYNCISIKGDLVIPDATTYIGASCFQKCTFDGILDLGKGVETIGEYAFADASKFTGNLRIPESTTTLGKYAFSQSGFTGNLVVGNNVTDIPEYCFYNCTKFAGTIKLGNNITAINKAAFYGCSKFTGNLVIPDAVETIAQEAFYNCTGFKGYLTIGSGTQTIQDYSFCKTYEENRYYYCALNFSKIYCKATTPPFIRIFSYVFGSLTDNGSDWKGYLGVPVGCKSAYTNHTVWGKFSTIEEVEFD